MSKQFFTKAVASDHSDHQINKHSLKNNCPAVRFSG